MAWVRRHVMTVKYTLRDRSSKDPFYSTLHIGELAGQLPNPNETEFVAFIGEFGSSLANLSDCHVEGASISLEIFNNAASTFGDAPDGERKAVFQFNTEDGFESILTVPGAKYAMFSLTDGETIIRDGGSFTGNPLASHLQSLHDKMVNGVTINLGTYPVVDRREKDLVSISDAYKQHRKNSRG